MTKKEQELNDTLKSLTDNMAANTKELADIHACMDRLSTRVHENADKVHSHATTLKLFGYALGAMQAIALPFIIAAALKGLNLN